jgi:hypothetical protein
VEPHDPHFDANPDEANPDQANLDAEGDAVEHLWNAAHEMLRAMRTLLDAADEFVESQRGGRPPSGQPSSARNPEPGEGRVHHIDIDVRSDVDARRTAR